jgi:hypothetical protein
LPLTFGTLAEKVVYRLLAALRDHDVVDLVHDAVFAEGAHGEDDLIPVVFDKHNGLMVH